MNFMKPIENKKQSIKKKIEQALNQKDGFSEKQSYTKSLEELVEELKVYQIELEFQNEELRRVQEDLEVSRNDYREMFMSAPVSYIIIDDNHKILHYNDVFIELFKPDIIPNIPYDLRKLISPEYQDLYHHFSRELLAEGQNDLRELKMISTHGRPRYMNVRGNMQHARSGKKKQYRISLTDITELVHTERELIRSQKRLDSVLQSQKEMICRFRKDTSLTYVNSAYLREFNRQYNELTGIKWIDWISEKDQIEILQNLNTLIENKGGVFEYTHEIEHANGQKIWYHWVNYAIFDKGEFVEFQSVGNNVQDKIERERLEKEVEIARNTLKFKQNFLASMSHEMRTPLTAIVGITELLKSTSLNKKQYDYICTLAQSSDNLKSVIDQVLDYSNLESGKVQLKPQDYSIRKLVADSNEFYKTICLKPIVLNIFIDDQLEDMLHFDHRRIFQVIKNLILNAVKFTPKGSIDLKVERNKELDNGGVQVKIIISDTGIGIEHEKQELLFSPFSQVQHIDTDRYKGIGLGLSFCKEIVELHHGDIGLISKPGKGTTVWFTFAAQEVSDYDESNISAERHSSNPADNLHILLVEDKSVTQKVISLMLKDMGHRVIIASHGKEALEVFPQYYFDMILMDIQMPVMDGITATQHLKEQYADLPPVVGLSANAFEGDRKKYMKLGLDEYLTKPVRKEDFQRIIAKVLQPKV